MARIPLKAVLRELKRREIRFAKSPREQVKMFGEFQRSVNEIIKNALGVDDYGALRAAIKKAQSLKAQGMRFVNGTEIALTNLLKAIDLLVQAGHKMNDDFGNSELAEIAKEMRKNREI